MTSNVPVKRQNQQQSLAHRRHQLRDLLNDEPFFSWPSIFNTDFDTRFANMNFDWVPKTDVKDNDSQLMIHSELPGMKKEDIQIDIDERNRILSMKGEHKHQEEEKTDTYFMRERSSGKFERKFKLPDNVDMGSVKANLKDGVLDITLAKRSTPETQAKKISIS